MHILWLHSLQNSSFLFCLWLRQQPKLRMGFSLSGLRSCLLEILSLWCSKSHFLQKQVFSVRQQCVATTSEHFWQIIFLNFSSCTFVKENWIRQQGRVCILCLMRKRWRQTSWSSSGSLKQSESNPSGIGQSSCKVYSLATTGNDFLGQILTTSSSCSCFSEGNIPSICPVWKIMPLWPGRLLNSKPFWQTLSILLEPVSDSGLMQASEMIQPLFSFSNWLLRQGLMTEQTRLSQSEALPRFSCSLYQIEFHSAFQGQICWYFQRQFFCRFSILNYYKRMLKSLLRITAQLVSHKQHLKHSLKHFSTKKGHSILNVLKEKEKAKYSTVMIGQQQMDLAETKGALSFVQKEKGVSQQSSELLMLSYTCSKCSKRETRSFSKCAHDQGIVLARCGGCDNVHLVADSLGWFDQEGNGDKLYDPVAIVKFLKRQFERNAAEERSKQ